MRNLNRYIFSICLLLFTSSISYAQSVKLPEALTGIPGIPIPITAEADGENVVWLTPDRNLVVIDGGFFKGDSKRALLFGPTGVYRLWCLTAKGSIISPKAECVITIGKPTPVPPIPPDPTPPGPTPDPTPVPPVPPAPIPAEGLRVLIVYETAELSKLPKEQLGILYSQEVRQFLNTHTALGDGGKTKEWRIWDKDVDTANETPIWQAAMKLPRKSIPWVVISNGKTGYEGPLPGTPSQFLELVKKYVQ